MSKSARWCFTVNNPGEWRPTYADATMSYLVWEIEHGANGTEHVQGYVRFKTRKMLETAKALISDRAHMEVAKGNEQQNRDYCTKEGVFTEMGTFDSDAGKQGRRVDLLDVAKKIKDGIPLRQIAIENSETFIQNHAGIEKMAKLLKPKAPQTRDVSVTVLWGPTATGKTHRIRTSYPEVYSVRPGKNPFDDYDDEDAILFDEFNWRDWPVYDMNMFLDKWPCRLNCRYSNKEAFWTKVFICANSEPTSWYPDQSLEIYNAFQRRLTTIHHVTSINDNLALVREVTDPNVAPAPESDPNVGVVIHPNQPPAAPQRPRRPLGSPPAATLPMNSSPDSSPIRPRALKRTFAFCASPIETIVPETPNKNIITID